MGLLFLVSPGISSDFPESENDAKIRDILNAERARIDLSDEKWFSLTEGDQTTLHTHPGSLSLATATATSKTPTATPTKTPTITITESDPVFLAWSYRPYVQNSAADWDAAFSHKKEEDLINGLVKVNGAGVYSAVTDNSGDWNEAYSKRVDTWTLPLYFSGNTAYLLTPTATNTPTITQTPTVTSTPTITQTFTPTPTLNLDQIVAGSTNVHLDTSMRWSYNTAYSGMVKTWTSPLAYSSYTASIPEASGTADGYMSTLRWSYVNIAYAHKSNNGTDHSYITQDLDTDADVTHRVLTLDANGLAEDAALFQYYNFEGGGPSMIVDASGNVFFPIIDSGNVKLSYGGVQKGFVTAHSSSVVMLGTSSATNWPLVFQVNSTEVARLLVGGGLQIVERTSEPAKPTEGKAILWMTDGTGIGDDGDIILGVTAGGASKYTTIHDHSAATAWP